MSSSRLSAIGPDKDLPERHERDDAVSPSPMASETAWIALGSNLGEPLEQLRRAARELEPLGELVARSRLYRTAPVGGPPGQGDYLNAVIGLRPLPAVAEPLALLEALLAIERRQGRTRRVRWGPRTLDLDLLAVGRRLYEGPGLVLPHPRMMERVFVLAPLCEVAPQWRHPRTGEGACEALRRLPQAGVEATELSWGIG